MLIRKKPPRPHALGEPLLHQNHPLPVTRRDFIAAGFLSGPAMVIGPAWLGALLKASRANGLLLAGTRYQRECLAEVCSIMSSIATS